VTQLAKKFRLLRSWMFHKHDNSSQQLFPILGEMNPVHNVKSHISKIYFIIQLQSVNRFPHTVWFSKKYFLQISRISHLFYMSYLSHCPYLYHPYNNWYELNHTTFYSHLLLPLRHSTLFSNTFNLHPSLNRQTVCEVLVL
jgi:hypothetical protein